MKWLLLNAAIFTTTKLSDNFKASAGAIRRKGGNMLLRLEIDHEEFKIYADKISADASDGFVTYYDSTDEDIIELCNERLLAPECGDYNDYTIIRED